MSQKSAPIYFFSFLLAFCSLFYELVYAQVFSVCLGGTKFQYLTIISVFACSLGFGSILHGRLLGKYDSRKVFILVEVLLMVLGATGAFFITWSLHPDRGPAGVWAGKFFSYGIVLMTGLLSGFEIPLLMGLKENAEGKILAADYLGMLTASVAFPFFFLTQLGTGASALIVASLNGSALVWLRAGKSRMVDSVLYVIILLVIVFIFTRKSELNAFLSYLYLGEV